MEMTNAEAEAPLYPDATIQEISDLVMEIKQGMARHNNDIKKFIEKQDN